MPLSYNLQMLKKWAEQSGLKFSPLPMSRNVTAPFDGRGACGVYDTCGDVCPTGARYSPDYTYQQLIAAKKVTLHDRTLVRRLILDDGKRHDRGGAGVSPGSARRDHRISRAAVRARVGLMLEPAPAAAVGELRAFPNGLANRSGLVGRYMNGHKFISAQAKIDEETFPGQNMTHSLISREYFRCATDKPFVRHDTRVWESSAGKEPRLAQRRWTLLLGDELLTDWRARALKGSSVRLRTYYDSHPSADSRLTLDPTSKNRYGDPMPKIERRLDAAADGARRLRRWRIAPSVFERMAQGEQRPPHRQAVGVDYWDHPGRRLPDGHRSGDQRLRQLRPHARSRKPVRDRRADAADRRLHERHADVRRAVAAIGRQDRSRVRESPATRRLGVLISGRGSNLKAMIDAIADGRLDASIAVVISNRADAPGLDHAHQRGHRNAGPRPQGLPTGKTTTARSSTRSSSAVSTLVCLAGFMRLLSPVFVDAFPNRILNIHPSLLPKYPGLHPQQQALDDGATESGATVHFVNKDLDAGPIVLQQVRPGAARRHRGHAGLAHSRD